VTASLLPVLATETAVLVIGWRPLDNPAYYSLTGPHARVAERFGRAARYLPDVAPFAALPPESDRADWADLAGLVGARGVAVLAATDAEPPRPWEILTRIPAVQLVGPLVAGEPEPSALRLGPADAPEMLDLVRRTRPGPFGPRTVELGTYLGLRREGALVAMAGERMRPGDWSELSAVCTDPGFRGQGLAASLVRALVAEIRQRGELPFLHVATDNHGAIRLYEALGFRLHRETTFLAIRAPGA
jgi:ribosomal protein S18 acetylase RimI-like enzyme